MPQPKYYKNRSSTSVARSSTFVSKKSGVSVSKGNICAKYLVIVESPSKCSKIEEYLGSEYQCIASRGHFRTIEGLTSINTKDKYQITFSIDPDKSEYVKTMKEIVSKYSPENIYLATDDDREGEAISWHICDVCELDPNTTHRILFHEITRPAILAAISTPTTINMSVVNAQKARQVLDMLVGYKISPMLWRHIYNDKTHGLSAGRCQTPALRLVYDNELEQSGNSIELQYKVRAKFTQKNLVCELNHIFENPVDTEEFLNQSLHFSHTLSIGAVSESVRSPPKPFSTSRLLQMSSVSPKHTMELAQQLYQMGLITYMRTDAKTYSPEFLELAKDYILSEFQNEKYLGDFLKIVNEDSSNPHEAIRCTNIRMTHIVDTNRPLCTLYQLIWRNTVESCMSAAKYEITKYYVSAPQNYKYEYALEKPVFPGWHRVSTTDENITSEINTASATNMYLGCVTKENIVWSKIETVASVKRHVPHYTESSLIQKLEDLGIGRPSTFSMLVSTIQERGYVSKQDVEGREIECKEHEMTHETGVKVISNKKVFGAEKNKLVLQSMGRLAIEFLIQHFDTIFEYNYTKTLEEQLDMIAQQSVEYEWYSVCGNCNKDLKNMLSKLNGLSRQVYLLDNGYEFVFVSSGAVLRRKMAGSDEYEYRTVRKDINVDLNKLSIGGYVSKELMEIPEEYLGNYESEDVLLKMGKYGAYIKYGEEVTIAIKDIEKPIREIRLADVIHMIDTYKYKDSQVSEITNVSNSNPNILRELTANLSVRKGKYGMYLYFQKEGMKKPEFYQIKGFKQNVLHCESEILLEWVKDKYKLELV